MLLKELISQPFPSESNKADAFFSKCPLLPPARRLPNVTSLLLPEVPVQSGRYQCAVTAYTSLPGSVGCSHEHLKSRAACVKRFFELKYMLTASGFEA